jgi:hypothetical protein
MSMSAAVRLLAIAAVATLAACASPRSRIDKDPAGFAKLPPEQQELIKQGKVGIGFDESAVKLALGEPSRITERTDVNGKSVIWRYVQYENDSGAMLYTGFYHSYYAPFSPLFIDASTTRRERDRLLVVFSDGKVSAIEQEVK